MGKCKSMNTTHYLYGYKSINPSMIMLICAMGCVRKNVVESDNDFKCEILNSASPHINDSFEQQLDKSPKIRSL